MQAGGNIHMRMWASCKQKVFAVNAVYEKARILRSGP